MALYMPHLGYVKWPRPRHSLIGALCCVLMPSFLAACGGSAAAAGGGGAGGGGGGSAPVTSIACALTGCEIAKLPLTTAMPTGTATYMGRASVTTQTAQGTLLATNADLGINVDFSARNLALSLTNIQTTSGAVSGAASGTGSISDNTLTAIYGGAISGNMAGTFRGTDAAAMIGEITLTGGGGTGGDAFGQFYANRQ